MKRAILLAAATAALTSVYACGHDDDHDHATGPHTSPYPSCNAITQACHQYDVGPGAIHDCHEIGHGATSDGPCAAEKDRCLALCAQAADGGVADASDAAVQGDH